MMCNASPTRAWPLVIIAGSFFLLGSLTSGPEATVHAAPPCPEIRPPEARMRYKGDHHIDVTLQIHNPADSEGKVPNFELHEWDYELQQWQPVETVSQQPVSANLRVLIIPDIAPDLLVIQPGQVRDPVPYLAAVFEQLLLLFNFSGDIQTDTGIIAIPGSGFLRLSRRQEELYNALMLSLPELATRVPSSPSVHELMSIWLEKEIHERRVIVIVRWQSRALHPDEYPIFQAYKQSVPLFVLDLDGKATKDTIKRLKHSGGEVIRLPLVKPWPVRGDTSISGYVKASIAGLDGPIETLREAWIVSFSSPILLDSSQMDAEDASLTRHEIVKVSREGCFANAMAKGRIDVRREYDRNGISLLLITSGMAIITNTTLIFMLALLIADERIQGFLKQFK